MHIADDLVILEPVDTQGNVVPYGQPADRVLLTNLYNLDQPLIRYDIADAMTITDAPCPCGCAHRRITDVQGRMDGVFEFRGGVAVPRREFERILLASPGVADFFVGQTDRGVDVSLVTDGSCDSERLRGRTCRFAGEARRYRSRGPRARGRGARPAVVRQGAAVRAHFLNDEARRES